MGWRNAGGVFDRIFTFHSPTFTGRWKRKNRGCFFHDFTQEGVKEKSGENRTVVGRGSIFHTFTAPNTTTGKYYLFILYILF